MLKKVFPFILLISLAGHAQTPKNQWVDSVFSELTVEQKIGQLFMVAISPKSDPDYNEKIEDAIKSHAAGGIIFLDGSPYQLATARNYIQKTSEVPVWLGVDATGGVGEHYDSIISFPPPLMLGAVTDNSWIYKLGEAQAQQLKELGLHINLASMASLYSTADIDRMNSFGEDKINVTQKALAYTKGMQDNNIISCIRNFPLETLTVVDVNADGLPLFNVTADSIRWSPYQTLIQNGIEAVVSTKNSSLKIKYEKKNLAKQNDYSAAVLSSIYIQQWLKNNTQYTGLLMADISALANESDLDGGEAEELAFLNGNDILLFPQAINPAIRRFKKLIKKDDKYEEQLNTTVKKILAAKYESGLASHEEILTDNLTNRLNNHEIQSLKNRLLERSVTVIKNENHILPIKYLEDNKIATVSIGKTLPNDFSEMTSHYAMAQHFSLASDNTKPDDIIKQLESFSTVLVAVFESPSKDILNALDKLNEKTNLVICLFDFPSPLKNLSSFPTIIEAYQCESMIRIVPESIFGALPVNAKLPVSINPLFPAGTGDSYESLKRLTYSTPEDVGMDARVLNKIESIAQEGILMEGTPGCYVLVAKDGKIVYEHSFGYFTYDSMQAVSDNTLYDLASITKVAATLQTVMFMYDKGLIDINKKASYYLPELKKSNKEDFTIKDILTHQAGLWPFLPFWAQTINTSGFMPEYYNSTQSDRYPYLVADHLYATTSMRDSLWNWIINSKIREKIDRTPYDYKYSDMGFYIFQHLAEKILNQPMQDFLNQNLYEPLGAYTMGYLPLDRFPASRIAPTEDDKLFRKRLLIGTVHDQGAAMHGGIAGHAGLFSTALDLAKLGQMLLQNGYYGGTQYYSPQTIKLFTRKQFQTSRRGLGFDKPLQSDWNGPTSLYASPQTFGHTGFTGTCLWVDPVFNLVYVFLSNRVYPDMTNSKLIRTNIRSRIQDTLYQSIFSYQSKN